MLGDAKRPNTDSTPNCWKKNPHQTGCWPAQHPVVLAGQQVADQAVAINTFIGFAKSSAVAELVKDEVKFLVEPIVRNDTGEDGGSA
ncbi:hypothetical protein ACRQ5Q_09350 [Bradyrhizobium sp. PMVTL-01]|uniref:hypothetical protein n=1 Tax=Bradyrhizobium sp. PMVTL-01 TaxID=3434999 RepID=UPI003F72B451